MDHPHQTVKNSLPELLRSAVGDGPDAVLPEIQSE